MQSRLRSPLLLAFVSLSTCIFLTPRISAFLTTSTLVGSQPSDANSAVKSIPHSPPSRSLVRHTTSFSTVEAPGISGLLPSSAIAGNPGFTLTVNGLNFQNTFVIRINGLEQTTTFVDSTQLTTAIPATNIALAGNFNVSVFDPDPNGGESAPVTFTINNPVPAITGLLPTSKAAGDPGFSLVVNGANFVPGSVVHIDGIARTTTLVSSAQVTAAILAADIALAGTHPVTVLNPAPGGGTSNPVSLTVTPVITTISPASVRAGGIGFTLTVDGQGFVTGSTVRVNGSNRFTTFINSTRLTASIQPSDIASVGTDSITVVTPAPASLVSNAVNLIAIPSISNLSPMTAVAGSPGFTITVAGSGFVNGSVVRWNGSNRATTFINSTRLTASISASDVASVRTRPVTVLNPAPNSLSSNALNFAITNPPPATECAIGADVALATPGLVNSGPSRAQIWRTDDNTWWGAFSNNTDGIYFYKRVNQTTWGQGPLIDTNFVSGVFLAGAPDCLWTGSNLFILIQESQTLARLYKYTYNSGAQTYSKVSGFPVNLPLIGIGTNSSGKVYGTLALQQDSTGRLWAAYTGGGIGGDGKMHVIWSTNSSHTSWNTTGHILATNLSTLKTEGSGIVSFGGNKIGVAWSNLNASENAFSFHNDADPPTTWSAKQTIDSGLGPEGVGPVAGKQISMKAHPDGRIFLLSDDNDGLNNHMHVYIRTAAGVWGSKTLVISDFTAMPSKGVLLLDTENSTIHVVYKDGALTTNGLMGQTFITQASMTNPAFNQACILIDTADNDGALSTSNPTSTKQNLNATTDLVVAASTGRNGNRILTNTVDLTPNTLTIFGTSPAAATAGEGSFTLTVTGKLFNSGSVVRFNNTSRTTTFVNAGKVTAAIPSSAIAQAGNYPVIVRNASPAADSNVRDFMVTATNPAPTVGLVSPNREPVGGPAFIMTISGTGFRRSSVVRLNGNSRPTQYTSDTRLTATIPASDLLVAGPYPITVFNPAPGGGTSAVTHVTTLYVMPQCNTSLGESFNGITLFNTVKSQMWFNDGLWWGAFSDNVGGIYFYKQSGNSFTKGALLSSNFNGRPDVFWNGTHLFALVYEFNTLSRLYKYTYNTTTDTYSLISGFPISLPLTGIGPGVSAAETGSITIAQDSTGKLWVAYPGSFIGGDGNYRVIWSTSDDHKTWNTTGHILATGASVDTQEVAPIIHFEGNKIGIVYSKQPTKEVAFIYHNDGDPEATWSTPEIVDSGLGHMGGGGVADNHMSLKAAPDGRLFLAAKDSDFPFGYINLYVRSKAGVWSNPVLIDVDPHAAVTRPTLVLDIENSEVYIFYADAITGYMYMNKASMNDPVFGPACPHIGIAGVSDSTSTKQNLTASTGLRAVGSTGGPTSAIHFEPITLAAGSGNAPVLSSVSPGGVGQNGGAATLTVTGSNFASDAVVFFNGSDRPTTFISPTQLSFKIFASDVLTVRTVPLRVMNPRGGSSSPVNLVVGAVIQSFSPTTVIAGDAGFTLTINGIGFVNGATVNFNGVVRPATFVNSTQLTTQIQASEILTFGTRTVIVVNPGGINSSPLSFPVSNPVPTVTSISPVAHNAGTGGLLLTVNGDNFNTSSVVSFNGLPRVTTFVSSRQLSAAILASDVALGGVFPIAVTNPAPGGGTSNVVDLTVNNPAPTLASISPTTRTAGTAAFTLTVSGTNFNNSSVVHWGGAPRPTTLVSSTQLTAQISASDIASGVIIPVTVVNPAPAGGTTTAADLTVNNPVPTLNGISPTSKTAGEAAFELTVNGTNFNRSSIVRLGGVNLPTNLISTTQLTAQLTAADIQIGGILPITVVNPAPSGGLTGALNLTVNNPVPTLTEILPAGKFAGDDAFVLTVNGTNFNNSSIVRFDGSDRITTFVSASQLAAQIIAADVQLIGDNSVTVFNPSPSGGISNASTLSVTNPVPTIGNVSPASVLAGNAAFALTVNGTNFVNGSVVQWNGQSRATTFVSRTQLTAQIPAADVGAEGTANLTVHTPAPGGGTSNTVSFNIDSNGRIVAVSSSSGNANSSVTVAVTFSSQGDENAVSFSLIFDPLLLSNPQATPGNGAPGATLSTEISQVAEGRLGITISLPAGQTFVGGLHNLARITFHTAAISSDTSTPIEFTDPPIRRQITNPGQVELPTIYVGGTVTITLGYEADISPRPNGSNTGVITVADWAQVGRFAALADFPNPGSEFQRADCAPRETFGNGSISIADWVQAGRYASGQDPAVPANGPTLPVGRPTTESTAKDDLHEEKVRTTLLLSKAALPDQGLHSVTLELATAGKENAIGFSLIFDATSFRFVSAQKSDASEPAILHINELEADQGRVGIALALPAGTTFGPGQHQVLALTFKPKTEMSQNLLLGFSDLPVAREIVDVNANVMSTSFQQPDNGLNPLENAQFFVAQHYLDFLNRSADSGGLEYWTNQLRGCGSDLQCLSQRRVAVSAAFFTSPEFQQTGYVVHRFYKAAYGRPPGYTQFLSDRTRLVSTPLMPLSMAEFAGQFVRRPEFLSIYPDSLSAEAFVTRLFGLAGIEQTLSERRETIAALSSGNKTRAQVLLALVENQSFKEREYNAAFVLMQYFGYLKRDPDRSGYDFWLNVLNNQEPENYRGMVCSFITSMEYQHRFGTIVTRTNTDCSH